MAMRRLDAAKGGGEQQLRRLRVGKKDKSNFWLRIQPPRRHHFPREIGRNFLDRVGGHRGIAGEGRRAASRTST